MGNDGIMRGFRRLAAFLLGLCLIVCLGASLALADEMPVPRSYRHVCTPAKSENSVPVYSQPKSSADVIQKLRQGETLEVAGESGKYLRVRCEGGQLGYILRDRVRLSFQIREDDLPDQIIGTVKLEDPIPKVYTNYLYLTGEIKADFKIDTLFAYIWDERQFRIEQAYMRQMEKPDTVIDGASLKGFLGIGNVKGGRKTFVLQGASAEGEMAVLYRSPAYIRSDLEDTYSVTSLCEIPNQAIQDTKVSTAWTKSERRPVMTVDIPEKAQAVLLTMEWQVIPDSVKIEMFGEGNELLSSETYATGRYADWVPLTPAVRRVTIDPTGKDVAMSTLRVYDDAYSRSVVQQWQEIPQKLDMMVIVAHQDDELLFLGGTIPYYAHQDIDMAVLYTADCGRLRIREALDGLWTCGLKNYPIFLGMEDKYTLNKDQALARWSKYEPQLNVVRSIRRYQPDVIVCQDFNGEYGHGQHKLTAEMVKEGIKLAADPDYDPDSAAQYGVWQVKKVYVHLYEENQIVMDWNQPMDDTGVITPLFIAKEAYHKHHSQFTAFSMEHHGELYDNTRFGLYFSTVGPDVEKNDFLENLR